MMAWFKRFSKARKAVAAAQDKETLREILQGLAGDGGRVVAAPVQAPVALGAGLLAAATGVGCAGFAGVAIALGAGAVLSWLTALAATRTRSGFIDDLVGRAGQLDYGLHPVEVDGKRTWKDWQREFADLRQGDEGQHIDRVTRGTWRAPDASGGALELTCFRFTFVTTRETTSTDSDGHTTTEKESTTHHRHGAIAQMPRALGVGFSELRKPALPAKWTTSSIEFNRRFKTGAASEMAAARLLTPATVLAASTFAAGFRTLDVQPCERRLYLGFADDDLLSVAGERRRSDDVAGLSRRIGERCAMPKLDALIDFLRVLDAASAPAGTPAHAASDTPTILEKT
jgi:hypothetical protein